MPTLFQDIVTPDVLETGKFDFPTWFPRNNIEYSEPRVRKVIAALQAQGVTRFASSGYCYGARSSFNFAFEGIVHVVVVSHPSMLQIPQDLEVRCRSVYSVSLADTFLQTYAAKAKAPLLINNCEVDSQFPIAAGEQADQILGEGKFTPGYLRTYWDGCTHGFAVRGDLVSVYQWASQHVLSFAHFCRTTRRSRLARKGPSKPASNGLLSTCRRTRKLIIEMLLVRTTA